MISCFCSFPFGPKASDTKELQNHEGEANSVGIALLLRLLEGIRLKSPSGPQKGACCRCSYKLLEVSKSDPFNFPWRLSPVPSTPFPQCHLRPEIVNAGDPPYCVTSDPEVTPGPVSVMDKRRNRNMSVRFLLLPRAHTVQERCPRRMAFEFLLAGFQPMVILQCVYWPVQGSPVGLTGSNESNFRATPEQHQGNTRI